MTGIIPKPDRNSQKLTLCGGKDHAILPWIWLYNKAAAFTKGQLISKCLFGIFNSPKKRTKNLTLPKFRFFKKATQYETIFHMITLCKY